MFSLLVKINAVNRENQNARRANPSQHIHRRLTWRIIEIQRPHREERTKQRCECDEYNMEAADRHGRLWLLDSSHLGWKQTVKGDWIKEAECEK